MKKRRLLTFLTSFTILLSTLAPSLSSAAPGDDDPPAPQRFIVSKSQETATANIYWIRDASMTYNLYRDGSLVASGVNSGSWTDTASAIGEQYTYEIAAVDSSGTESSNRSRIVVGNNDWNGLLDRGITTDHPEMMDNDPETSVAIYQQYNGFYTEYTFPSPVTVAATRGITYQSNGASYSGSLEIRFFNEGGTQVGTSWLAVNNAEYFVTLDSPAQDVKYFRIYGSFAYSPRFFEIEMYGTDYLTPPSGGSSTTVNVLKGQNQLSAGVIARNYTDPRSFSISAVLPYSYGTLAN